MAFLCFPVLFQVFLFKCSSCDSCLIELLGYLIDLGLYFWTYFFYFNTLVMYLQSQELVKGLLPYHQALKQNLHVGN